MEVEADRTRLDRLDGSLQRCLTKGDVAEMNLYAVAFDSVIHRPTLYGRVLDDGLLADHMGLEASILAHPWPRARLVPGDTRAVDSLHWPKTISCCGQIVDVPIRDTHRLD